MAIIGWELYHVFQDKAINILFSLGLPLVLAGPACTVHFPDEGIITTPQVGVAIEVPCGAPNEVNVVLRCQAAQAADVARPLKIRCFIRCFYEETAC